MTLTTPLLEKRAAARFARQFAAQIRGTGVGVAEHGRQQELRRPAALIEHRVLAQTSFAHAEESPIKLDLVSRVRRFFEFDHALRQTQFGTLSGGALRIAWG